MTIYYYSFLQSDSRFTKKGVVALDDAATSFQSIEGVILRIIDL